jgi:1,4-alpha-glucan branching enzyme
MPASLAHIDANTPMGANLVADGATFRVWAPNARSVHVTGDFNQWTRNDDSLLTKDESSGHWRGFLPGVRDRERYMFYVVGEGSEGPKRDPYARELQNPFPPGHCIIRKPDFPWHETGYRTPRFPNFVIYQLHVGTFFTPNFPPKGGTFLDVARKIPYLVDLGVTAVQLLPIQEFQTKFSMGYNGTDYFSPEMDFGVEDAQLQPYVDSVNELLRDKGLQPYQPDDLRGEMNQLKALIDLCHIYGLAVLLDVVYNHAGGDFGKESIYFFDRQRPQLALLHRQGPRRGTGVRLQQARGARISHPERRIFPRRVPRGWLPLRPGKRDRPRRRPPRLAVLPGVDDHAASAPADGPA